MIEQFVQQVIGTSRAVCSGIAQSPWLEVLGLTCKLSNEVLLAVLAGPIALLWITCDLLIAGSRTRAIRKASAMRLEDLIARDMRRVEGEWVTGAVEHGWHKPEAFREDTCPTAPMFGPIRVMKWV